MTTASNLNFERSGIKKNGFFSSSDIKSKFIFVGHEISIGQWDKRTPGKFKPEFVGDGIICLNSKVYHKKVSRQQKRVVRERNRNEMNY